MFSHVDEANQYNDLLHKYALTDSAIKQLIKNYTPVSESSLLERLGFWEDYHMMYLAVKDVKALDNYLLLLKFENEEEKLFDLKPYLEIGKFKELKMKIYLRV